MKPLVKDSIDLVKVSGDTSGFKAGCIKQYLSQWKDLTSDPNILAMVQGCKIRFANDMYPVQHKVVQIKFNLQETQAIESEIQDRKSVV